MHIYKGVVPFICLQWVGLIVCILLPDLVLWIPRALFGIGAVG